MSGLGGLRLTARSVTDPDTVYRDLDHHGLDAAVRVVGGSGAAADPHELEVTVTARAAWSGVVHLELPFKAAPVPARLGSGPRFFLPAFMYGHNRGEAPQRVPHEFPRLRPRLARPSAPAWMVRADRLTHPVALAHDGGRVRGLAAPAFLPLASDARDDDDGVGSDGVGQQGHPPVQFLGFTCSLGAPSVGVTIGWENAPWLFVNAARVHDRADLSEGAVTWAAGESLTLTLHRYDYAATEPAGVGEAIEDVYRRVHQPPRIVGDAVTAVRDLVAPIRDEAWLPHERAYAGFVFEKDGGHEIRELPSITWTNGLAVSVPMLLAALRLGDAELREQALSHVELVVAEAVNPVTGLFFETRRDGVWGHDGWWFDGVRTPGHSGYLVGKAAHDVLEAYDYEARLAGVRHDDWLDVVAGVVERTERTRNSDGEYPFIFSSDTGAGIEYDSVAGVWCLAAAAYLAHLRGGADEATIAAWSAAVEHYHRRYIATMECYGGPLDTDKAVDSEGVLALVRALRWLHVLTGRERFLDLMRAAMGFELSFRFAYNVPVQVPPLSPIGWSSSGGTVTSTANPHVHPMGSQMIDDLVYYTGVRADDYLASRLEDAVGWGNQTYNTVDGEFDHGKVGWMSERFAHSQGLLTESYPDGSPASTWFCLMPWAGSCIVRGVVGEYWEARSLSVAPRAKE